MISGFRRRINEICAPLGLYAAGQDCLTPADVTDSLSRNVVNYHSTPRAIPEELISQAGFYHHPPHCKAEYLTYFEGRILGAFRYSGLSLRVAGN
jgi:hypothetical protein